MEFKVNNPSGIIVKQLGAFDHQGNGISGSIRVAIFNKSTGTIVPGLDVTISGAADPYTNNYRFKTVGPVTLDPGTYAVVAKGYNASELNGNGAFPGVTLVPGDLANGAISYVGSGAYGNEDPNSFVYPSNVDGGPANRYLAGTFVYDEPASSAGGPGNNRVIISVKDVNGNTGYATATVTVQDIYGVCNLSSAAGKEAAVPSNSAAAAQLQAY